MSTTNNSANEQPLEKGSEEKDPTSDGIVESSSPIPLEISVDKLDWGLGVRVIRTGKAFRMLCDPRNFRMATVINSLGPISEGRLFEVMRKGLGTDHRKALEKMQRMGWVKIGQGDAAWPSRILEATEWLKKVMMCSGLYPSEKSVRELWGRQDKQH